MVGTLQIHLFIEAEPESDAYLRRIMNGRAGPRRGSGRGARWPDRTSRRGATGRTGRHACQRHQIVVSHHGYGSFGTRGCSNPTDKEQRRFC
jgi:hypothetical protein